MTKMPRRPLPNGIRVRIPERKLDEINNILERNRKYHNLSDFVREAVDRLIAAEKI